MQAIVISIISEFVYDYWQRYYSPIMAIRELKFPMLMHSLATSMKYSTIFTRFFFFKCCNIWMELLQMTKIFNITIFCSDPTEETNSCMSYNLAGIIDLLSYPCSNLRISCCEQITISSSFFLWLSGYKPYHDFDQFRSIIHARQRRK